MKTYFKESIKIISSNLIFILILAFLGIYIPSGAMRWFLPFCTILGFIITTVAYGRLAGVVAGEHYVSFVEILKAHWLNYLTAWLIVGIAAFLFASLFSTMVSGPAVLTATQALTIYVWPLVFLRRNPIIAIRSGVKCLLCNFIYSLPLVLLALLAAFIGRNLRSGLLSQDYSFMLVTLKFVSTCVWWFIQFTIFTTASMVLVNQSDFVKRAERISVILRNLAFLLILCLLPSLCFGGYNVTYQTCEECGSTRSIKAFPIGIKSERIHHRSPSFDLCIHQWKDGVYEAVEDRVADGEIVLVKKGIVYGAFIVWNKSVGHDPGTEEVEYKWWYRVDGKGTFTEAESRSFRSGTGKGRSTIEFGPFSIMWSSRGPGQSSIYYDHFAGDMISRKSLRICVTNETNIETINATDEKWVYKASPIDL